MMRLNLAEVFPTYSFGHKPTINLGWPHAWDSDISPHDHYQLKIAMCTWCLNFHRLFDGEVASGLWVCWLERGDEKRQIGVHIHDAGISKKLHWPWPDVEVSKDYDQDRKRPWENMALSYKMTSSPLCGHLQRRPTAPSQVDQSTREVPQVKGSKEASVVNLKTKQERGAQLWVQHATSATRKDITVSNATPRIKNHFGVRTKDNLC